MPVGRFRADRTQVEERVTGLAYVRAWFGRFWLAVWFGAVTLAYLGWRGAVVPTFGDAQLYLEATREWLAGGDPWSVAVSGLYFAAPPPTLLVLAPLAVLPEPVGLGALVGSVVLAAVATIRMLRLPWWWLLFPPLVQGVLAGNIQIWLVPLLIGGAGPIAVLAKVYAAVPLLILGRWRQLAATAILLLATAPFLRWETYLVSLGAINARLAEQSNYGLPTPILLALLPLGLLALWRVGRERAAWLAVPALWPAQQWYYATLAMPSRSHLACALIAVPVPGSGLLAALVLAVQVHRERRVGRER